MTDGTEDQVTTLTATFVTIPIVGSRTVEQLRQCLRAAELTLSPQELAYLEAAEEARPDISKLDS